MQISKLPGWKTVTQWKMSKVPAVVAWILSRMTSIAASSSSPAESRREASESSSDKRSLMTRHNPPPNSQACSPLHSTDARQKETHERNNTHVHKTQLAKLSFRRQTARLVSRCILLRAAHAGSRACPKIRRKPLPGRVWSLSGLFHRMGICRLNLVQSLMPRLSFDATPLCVRVSSLSDAHACRAKTARNSRDIYVWLSHTHWEMAI